MRNPRTVAVSRFWHISCKCALHEILHQRWNAPDDGSGKIAHVLRLHHLTDLVIEPNHCR